MSETYALYLSILFDNLEFRKEFPDGHCQTSPSWLWKKKPDAYRHRDGNQNKLCIWRSFFCNFILCRHLEQKDIGHSDVMCGILDHHHSIWTTSKTYKSLWSCLWWKSKHLLEALSLKVPQATLIARVSTKKRNVGNKMNLNEPDASGDTFAGSKRPRANDYSISSCLDIKLDNRAKVTDVSLTKHCLRAVPLTLLLRYPSLSELSLADNFIRYIPSAIERLSNLTELNLSWNRLKDVPREIGNLKSLKWLNLAGNHLTSVPEELGELKNLVSLVLHGNDLIVLPSTIGHLASLLYLDVSENRLRCLPQGIGELCRLERFHVQGNKLRTLHSLDWRRLSRLRHFLFQHNRLRFLPFSFLEWFRRCRQTGRPLTISHSLPVDVLYHIQGHGNPWALNGYTGAFIKGDFNLLEQTMTQEQKRFAWASMNFLLLRHRCAYLGANK